MTQRDLNRLLTKWQERMKLQDWKITIRFDHPGELEDVEARTEYDEHYRTALMAVRRDTDEVETTVVHELVHIALVDWKPPKDKVAEERTVIQLSEALTWKRKSK